MDKAANNKLILWKLGCHPDIGYCAGNQEFANDVLALMKEAKQLEAELAAEREKVKSFEDAAVTYQRQWFEVSEQLAAAQRRTLTLHEKREFAVALKVPRSGIHELDDMIRESRRLDIATEMLAHRTQHTDYALTVANALLAASEKEEGK